MLGLYADTLYHTDLHTQYLWLVSTSPGSTKHRSGILGLNQACCYMDDSPVLDGIPLKDWIFHQPEWHSKSLSQEIKRKRKRKKKPNIFFEHVPPVYLTSLHPLCFIRFYNKHTGDFSTKEDVCIISKCDTGRTLEYLPTLVSMKSLELAPERYEGMAVSYSCMFKMFLIP